MSVFPLLFDHDHALVSLSCHLFHIGINLSPMRHQSLQCHGKRSWSFLTLLLHFELL